MIGFGVTLIPVPFIFSYVADQVWSFDDTKYLNRRRDVIFNVGTWNGTIATAKMLISFIFSMRDTILGIIPRFLSIYFFFGSTVFCWTWKYFGDLLNNDNV